MVTIKTQEQGEAFEKVLSQYDSLAGITVATATVDGEIRLQHPADATTWRIFPDGTTRSR